ncbi:hypothetical protein OROGR_013628 [Orobanche gracilis]
MRQQERPASPLTVSTEPQQEESVPLVETDHAERPHERSESPVIGSTEKPTEESVPPTQPEEAPIPEQPTELDAPESSDGPNHLSERINGAKDANQPASPRTAQKIERLHTLRLQIVLLQDAVQALYDLVSNEIILKEEQSILRVGEAKTKYALEATQEQLIGHDTQIKDLERILDTLVNKVTAIETNQNENTNLLISIDMKVTSIDDDIKGKGSRATARMWRQEQEQLFEASMEDSISAAIKRLAEPSPHYRVIGSRPEFHDPHVNWKKSIHSLSAINLPTDCHPTEDEVRKWRKNEVM